MKKYLKHGIYALISGLMVSFTMPSDIFTWGISLLTFVALVPLLVATYRSKKKRELLWLATIFGVTHALVVRYWLAFFHDFGTPILVALSLWFIIVSFTILLIIHYTRYLRASSRIWAVAWLWTAIEYIRQIGFLADPWALLAYGFGQSRYVIQVIDITGPMGLTFLVMLSNAILAQWLVLPTRLIRYLYAVRYAVGIFGLFLLFSVGYGVWQESRHQAYQVKSGREAHIILVQQNMNPWRAYWKDLVRAHIEAVGMLEPFSVKPDLIVSSETTLLGNFTDIMRMGRSEPKELPLLIFIRNMDTYHLFGAMDITDEFYHNSVFLVNKEGEMMGTGYHKQRLVPFGEALPFVEWQWVGDRYRKLLGTPTLQIRGKESKIFSIPLQSGDNLAFGVSICFEDSFSSVTRDFVRQGAQVIINITNDSWSERESAEIQHMAIGRYRSIETRRPTLRAANGGMTVHIDEFGDYITSLAPFERGALAVSLNVVERPLTIYTQLGEWFSYIALVMGGLYIIMRYSQLPSSSLFSWGKALFKRSSKA